MTSIYKALDSRPTYTHSYIMQMRNGVIPIHLLLISITSKSQSNLVNREIAD